MVHAVCLFLAQNPLLLLFATVALGYPISRLQVRGASLGVASILFAGIALGALVITPDLDPALKQDLGHSMKLVYELGLAVFVYAMGLAIAGSFWAAFSREGIKKNATVLVVMLVATAVVAIGARLLHFNARYAAGLLAGSFTNMPALAGVIERVKATAGGDPVLIAQPTVASAIAYPVGVLVPMLVILLSRRVLKVDLKAEAQGLTAYHTGVGRLDSRTVRVTDPAAAGCTHRDLRDRWGCKVVLARLRRDGETRVVDQDLAFQLGDLLVMVGAAEDLERATARLGQVAEVALEQDGREFDSTRVFVSNGAIIGRPLRDLDLPGRCSSVITRLRRGDQWFVPDGDTVLELGDRVRVVTRIDNLDAVAELFGDSYRELSEVSFLTFAIGLAAGLALGQVPIPLGPGIVFKLGFAGGPLVAALVLGRFHRVGPFVWNFPYSANHTVRQFGLALFAAGIGLISGEGFRTIVARDVSVLPLFLGAALGVSLLADVLAMAVGYGLFRIPLNVMFGILAGTHTQPVVLGYANQQTGNELPNVGFAAVYPLATILKIILAQALLLVA